MTWSQESLKTYRREAALRDGMPGPRTMEVYRVIHQFIERNGFAPTLKDICNAMGIRSTSTAQSHMLSLERVGWIRRERHRARSVRIVGGPLYNGEGVAIENHDGDSGDDRITRMVDSRGRYAGFEWGPMTVHPMAVADGRFRVVNVRLPDGDMYIVVSWTGRSVKISAPYHMAVKLDSRKEGKRFERGAG